jgi:hypothetical protein
MPQNIGAHGNEGNGSVDGRASGAVTRCSQYPKYAAPTQPEAIAETIDSGAIAVGGQNLGISRSALQGSQPAAYFVAADGERTAQAAGRNLAAIVAVLDVLREEVFKPVDLVKPAPMRRRCLLLLDVHSYARCTRRKKVRTTGSEWNIRSSSVNRILAFKPKGEDVSSSPG